MTDVMPLAFFTVDGFAPSTRMYLDGSTLKVDLPAQTGTGLTPGTLWASPDGTLYRIES